MKKHLTTLLFCFCILPTALFSTGNREAQSQKPDIRPTVTVQDSADRFVTIPKPLERVVILWSNPAEEMQALGAIDRIVGIDESTRQKVDQGFYPELADTAQVGTWDEPNYEAIAALHPDAVIMLSSYPPLPDEVQKNLDPFGIPVVALDFYRLEVYFREVKILGFMLGKEEEAAAYTAFFQDMYADIESRINSIPAEKRKRVYFEGAKTYQTYGGAGYGSGIPQLIRMAGGIDLYPEFSQPAFEADPEDVAMRNPQVIIKGDYEGYNLNDTQRFSELHNEINSRPELSMTEAVKSGETYVLSFDVSGGARKKFGPVFLAPILYPEIFQDIDPESFLEKYMTEYQHMSYRGVYQYPAGSAKKVQP